MNLHLTWRRLWLTQTTTTTTIAKLQSLKLSKKEEKKQQFIHKCNFKDVFLDLVAGCNGKWQCVCNFSLVAGSVTLKIIYFHANCAWKDFFAIQVFVGGRIFDLAGILR